MGAQTQEVPQPEPASDEVPSPESDTDAATSPEEAPPTRFRRWTWPPVLVLAAMLVSGAYLMWLGRTQWFSVDDFDSLLVRPIDHSFVEQYFAPHNEHLITIPQLAYTLITAMFGAGSYLPFMVPVVAAHLLLLWVLYRLLLHLGAAAWVSALLVASVALSPVIAENLLWAFQIGFVLATACGLAALDRLIRTPGGPTTRDALWAALLLVVALLSTSSMVVVWTLVCGIVAVQRGGARIAAIACGPALLAFGAWFAVYRPLSGDHVRLHDPLDLPRVGYEFLVAGMSATAEAATGIPAAGGAFLLLLVVLIGVLASRGRPDSTWAALAALLGVVALYYLAGLARGQLGSAAAVPGRYQYVAWVLCIPAIGLGLSMMFGRRRQGTIAMAALLALLIPYGALVLRAEAGEQRELEQSVRNSLAGAAWVFDTNQGDLITDQVQPMYAPGVAGPQVQRLAELGGLDGIELTPDDKADAVMAMQVAFGPSPRVDGQACPLVPPTGTEVAPGLAAAYTPNGGSAMVQVRVPGADDWQALREVRLPAGGAELLSTRPWTLVRVTTVGDTVLRICGQPS